MGISRRQFPRSSSWPRYGGWKRGCRWGMWHEGWKSTPTCCTAGGVSSGKGPATRFPARGQRRWSEGRIAELERKIGQQALEIDFLKGCLQRIEEQRMLQAFHGNPPSTGRLRKK